MDVLPVRVHREPSLHLDPTMQAIGTTMQKSVTVAQILVKCKMCSVASISRCFGGTVNHHRNLHKRLVGKIGATTDHHDMGDEKQKVRCIP
jgi:hypothetical protein